ncbi:hypothetical protein MVEN_01184600 [Mycena venus]|uniref:Uncharacterized protein n=1 Tax=Mycena venus TaxID=2733690 RepID=A0A8H7CYL7_9AGAR|nr:hypothetical protein MVEN_01184600 [Mycena venus]
MATAYGVAERAADLIKATYGAPITSSDNSSSTDSGLISALSTGTKVAIGAASGVAALALIAALFLVRRRNTNKRRAALSRAAAGKEDPWYADDLPMQPRAPFMSANKRHSAQPSEISTDTAVTLSHPDNQQHVEYGQDHYGLLDPHTGPGPYAGGLIPPSNDQFDPYGAVHSNLTTADVAPLHPPVSPTHSSRYTASNLNHLP